MSIILKNKDGVLLKTAGKYCPEDIIVVPQLQAKTATANGDILPDNGYCGLEKVTVNVPATPTQEKTITITENGTQEVVPDSGKALSKVTITTNVPSVQPTLNAPTISLSGSTITITNPSSNGNFATSYKIFNGSTLLATVTSTTVDLSAYISTAGTYTITAKASAANFNDSAASNSVSYVVKTQSTPAISLVSGTTIQIDTIDENATTIEVYADGTKIGEVAKQGGASKQTIDVSTLSGWESLASGNHSITIKTKASGYLDSASSNAVTVSKAASGYKVTVNYSTDVSEQGYIYDGQNKSATSYRLNQGTNEITIQSGYAYVEGDDPSGMVYVGYFQSKPTVSGGVSIENWDASANYGGGSALFKVTGEGTINISFWCFVEGTLITLADGSTKPVEDIDYTDDILVWDFDNGVQSSAKPCWIAKPNVAPCYWEITLSDGTVLKLVGANGKSHRLFNSRGKFVYPQDFENSEQTVKQDGSTPYIVKCEKIYKEVRYYNFATDRALNNYANGVLCGCRFSNVYPIENMKYIKDDRTLATREEYKEIPDKLFYGLRLAEQQNLNDSPDNVNYYHTMKEHVIHNYIEHERDYKGNADYETWLFKQKK